MGMRNPPSPIRFPRKAICDQCGKPFETLGDDTTCTQCMIKPSRRPTDFPPVPKEIIMAQPCNPKACIDCHKTYTPTSNVQKRCPACMKEHKHVAKPKAAKAEHPFGKDLAAAPVIKKANGSRAAASPAITVACTMHDTVAVFRALADAGCTCLVFENMKISIEAL
jgi:hypothetical protein